MEFTVQPGTQYVEVYRHTKAIGNPISLEATKYEYFFTINVDLLRHEMCSLEGVEALENKLFAIAVSYLIVKAIFNHQCHCTVIGRMHGRRDLLKRVHVLCVL